MSAELSKLISLNNPVYRSYVFWSSVLVVKILGMSLLTGIQRFRNQAFANQEDLPSKKLKVKFDCEAVERVRRAHRNDLENIIPFFIAGYFYCLTDPSEFLAVNLFRACALSRVLHTIVYAVVPLPQPSRALSFFVCLAGTTFMAVKSALYFL